MADTIDPRPVVPGSVAEAQNAFLGLMEPEEEKPETEDSAPAEDVDESTEETQDESSEEDAELEEPTEEEEEDDEVEESEEEESDEMEDGKRLYEVTIDGEQHEVSLEELQKGYSRQSDYTRKTQELAEQRKEMQALVEQAQHEMYQTQQFRQQYIDAASAVVQQQYGKLNDLVNNTDWERLKLEDREEYLTKKSEVADLESSLAREQQQVQEAMEQAQYEQQEAQRKIAVQERQKLEAIIPEWKNREFRQKIGKELTEFAVSQGFTKEEMSQLTDHRSLLILMQAKAFQELKKAQTSGKAKIAKSKPKMVKSGVGKKKQEEVKSKRVAQMKRLKQTGKAEDAASLFEDFIDL